MSDPRFFNPLGPFTVERLAEASGSKVLHAQPNLLIRDVAALKTATREEIAFLDNPKYERDLAECDAGAIILTPELAPLAPKHAALIVNAKPRMAYAHIAQLFYPVADDVADAISSTAHIAPSATLGNGCVIDTGAVIGENVKLGDNVRIGPNATIGRGVEIGDQTYVGANASISHCIMGSRCRILPGARIGQEGFGFAMDVTGHVRIPQLGRVIIGDDVEVGANSTIDRGAGPDTVIESGTMIDNLVQIGHNVSVGKRSVIVSQAGISGSTRLGTQVVIGGQVGIAGHLVIGNGAQIAGGSGIMRDVPAGARMMGYPAVGSRQFFRQIAWLAKNTGGEKGE